jgi:hypothetical protein
MWHALDRREKCIRFWWETARQRWEVGIRINLGEIFWVWWGWGGGSGFNWLRIVTGGGLL